MGTINSFKNHCVTYFILIFFILFFTVGAGLCIEEVPIGNNPMEAESKAPPAVIMFILDNSGSMDWEYMIQGSGLFTDAGGSRENLYEAADYENGTDSAYGDNLVGADRRFWRSRWADHNRIYYNPAVTFEPWPAVSGNAMGNASMTKPFSNPYNNLSTDSKLDLDNTYVTLAGVDLRVAHYFVQYPDNGDANANKIYLVNFTSFPGGTRVYYEFTGGVADLSVDAGQLTSVASTEVPPAVRALTDAEDLQNFANWVSYYKRRELTAKAAVAITIRDLSGVKVGFYTLHIGGPQGVRRAAVDVHVSGSDFTDSLLHDLYDIDSNSGTPLRIALKNVGEYFKYEVSGDDDGGLGTSPYASATGADCQFTFAIAMTDGVWNGSTSPGVGNSDNTSNANYTAAAPYMDGNSETLADVAMEYYKNDLATTVDNNVPVGACDYATWQHMITYGVSFGVTGVIDPANYPPCEYKLNGTGATPVWNTNRIDDLYHASVNGRGEFLSAADPSELVSSLGEIINSIHARQGTAASVTINTHTLVTTSMFFQSFFNSDKWTGNVKAKTINSDGTIEANPLWNAEDYFSRTNPAFIAHDSTDKKIVTYNSALALGSRGIEFKYSDLTAAQLTNLYPIVDAAYRQNVVDVIRGKEVAGFRVRSITLGDIIHSSPMVYKNSIFVGANDGMLHVFDTANGKERFAYIPDLVMGNFYNTADVDKSFYGVDYGLDDSHRFFVDQSVFIRQGVDSRTLLVGGLGKGGNGIYCLDITDADAIANINDAKNTVKWEYPVAATPVADSDDMGFSYSRPVIAKANADIDGDPATSDWIAIFGNGYNSVNGNAVLFILNAKTGELVKKIDTNIGAGLSSAAVTDINRDLAADYVYAGDLDGNMWKFDLRGTTVAEWDVAYKDGADPKPLINVGKPITVRPDVMLHCDYGGGTLMCGAAPPVHKPLKGYIVTFGTGKFLFNPDDFTSGDQYMFGIWDFGDDDDDSEYLGDWNPVANTLSNISGVKLLEQSIDTVIGDINTVNFGIVKVLTDNPAEWRVVCDSLSTQDPDPDTAPISPAASHVGWFRLLQPDFMVTADPIIWAGHLIYIEMNPSGQICESGGESWLWEVNACTGGRIMEAVFDTDGDGDIDSDDIEGPGLYYPEIIYPPAIVGEEEGSDNEEEYKFFPGTGGTVTVVKERSQPKGFVFWQVLQQ